MGTKLDKVLTYDEKLTPIKAHNLLNMSCDVTR